MVEAALAFLVVISYSLYAVSSGATPTLPSNGASSDPGPSDSTFAPKPTNDPSIPRKQSSFDTSGLWQQPIVDVTLPPQMPKNMQLEEMPTMLPTENPIPQMPSIPKSKKPVAPKYGEASYYAEAGYDTYAEASYAPTYSEAAYYAQASYAPKGQYRDGTYTGPSVNVVYGDVQVAAVISGGRLTDIHRLQWPQDRANSKRISDSAIPILIQEAIDAQSANIQAVAGASATSPGFIQSLQGALDQAKN